MPTGAAPRRPSLLVGRDEAVETLLAALAAHRVVTVLGAPGMGKTALAREVATRLEGATVWVDLTGCIGEGHALATIARALGARPPRGVSQRSLAQWLGRELDARAIVTLVLDEAESVAAELAPVLAELGGSAPRCRFLLTSRERLGDAEEHVLELGALAVGDAARLFVTRAERGGAPKVRDAGAVEALVVALDGLPLAIELAASRARLLSPTEILSRLSRRLDLLSGGGASKSRHRALRAAIDGSWEALSPTLQSALAQASCFSGGFAVPSAEAVIELGPGESVLDALSALRDRALLSRAGETSRFHLLASIRAYAAERLDERGDADAVHRRHAAHYLSLAERHAVSIAARGDAESRAALLIEQDNVTRVLRDPRTSDVDVVRGTLALETVMATHGPFDGLLERLDDAVRRSASPAVPTGLRARALLARGNTHGIQGHTAESVADLDACLSLSRALGDRALEGEALMMLTVRYRQQSRIAEAWACGQRSLTLLGEHGRPSIKGGIWAFVGRFAAEELGDLGLARELDERARALFRDLGDRWSEGLALGNLAQLDHVEGRVESAKWYFAETLAAFREVGDRRYEGAYLAALANLLHETGDLDGARGRYHEACVVLGAARVGHVEGITRAAAGALEADAGRLAEARIQLDHAASLLARTGAASFGDVLALHRGHLELADVGGDRAAALVVRSELARRRADLAARWGARIPVVPRAVPLERRAGDLAFALRLLDHALAPSGAALEIGPDARWFRPPGGDEVPMLRRGAVRLVLLALARSRATAPGVALARDALLEAGWPGERVLAEAGATRVRVAIATLRSLGLGDVLQTRDDGYLLDPNVAFFLR